MADLKTNYVDDVLDTTKNQLRKYQQIQNDDGTVSFVDVTEYTQVGTSFGAKDINDTNAAINDVNGKLGKEWLEVGRTNSLSPIGVAVALKQYKYIRLILFSNRIDAEDSRQEIISISEIDIDIFSKILGIRTEYISDLKYNAFAKYIDDNTVNIYISGSTNTHCRLYVR